MIRRQTLPEAIGYATHRLDQADASRAASVARVADAAARVEYAAMRVEQTRRAAAQARADLAAHRASQPPADWRDVAATLLVLAAFAMIALLGVTCLTLAT